MSLAHADVLELLERYEFLLHKYVPLAAELAPKLEQFGKYKKELQILSTELASRGVTPDEPESLRKLVETVPNTDREDLDPNGETPDTSQGD